MHTDENLIEKWIHYATLDAEVTFYLAETLKSELKKFESNF